MEFVTIKKISSFLKVKESTLYSWVHSGTIPCYKLNGLLRFDMTEIKEWIKGSRLKPCNVTNVKTIKSLNIDSIVKKAIENVKNKGYNLTKRETRPNQGLKREVQDGAL